MLQVARLAPKLLGDSTELVRGFLLSQLNADGGFRDRDGASDLYYTVFGLEGLLALQAELPAESVATYLRSFGEGAELDFVHLACLARCWADLPSPLRARQPTAPIAAALARYRTVDGGYNGDGDSRQANLYGCFMAVNAFQDLGREPPDAEAIMHCVQKLRSADGGYSNLPNMQQGLTPSTAAAATLLRYFGQSTPPQLDHWLLAQHAPDGGFYALPGAPLPDLLSTATALHGLTGLHADIRPIQDACLDFIDSLWTNQGGFHGNWADDALDCEYTYYGLLALGHLSL